MKTKSIAMLYIVILSIGTMLSLYIPKNEVTANEMLVIPNEAIRLRILANSDSEKDQEVKREVRDAINKEITEWVADLTSVDAARSLIQSRIPEIQQIAEEILADNRIEQAVDAKFGNKVEFPTKLYGEFLYPAGQYEAILVTIGEGQGANWWCVLFPPLCFLDFSNGVAVSEGFEEGEQTEEIVDEESEQEETPAEEEVDEDSEQGEDPAEKEEVEDEEPLFVEEEEEEVEVKFFLVELFQKIFG